MDSYPEYLTKMLAKPEYFYKYHLVRLNSNKVLPATFDETCGRDKPSLGLSKKVYKVDMNNFEGIDKVTTFTKLTLAGAMLLAATTSLATLAGHNIILVHGFQSHNLFIPPTTDAQIEQNGYDYWSQYWNQRAEARFDWPSNKRVEGGIAEQIYKKAVALSKSGFCQNGCVLVTHSTGDLVTRYFLEHQEDWLASAGYQPLNILLVLDFAGAGGGTELADAAVSATNSTISRDDSPMMEAIESWLGGTVNASLLGVVYDLQPIVARNLATSPNSIPRLRFTRAGSDFMNMTEPFISGMVGLAVDFSTYTEVVKPWWNPWGSGDTY